MAMAKEQVSQGVQCHPEDLNFTPLPEVQISSSSGGVPQQAINPADLHPASWFDLHREASPLSTLSGTSAITDEPEVQGSIGVPQKEDTILGKRQLAKQDDDTPRPKKNAKTNAKEARSQKADRTAMVPKEEDVACSSKQMIIKPYPKFKGWPPKPRRRLNKRDRQSVSQAIIWYEQKLTELRSGFPVRSKFQVEVCFPEK